MCRVSQWALHLGLHCVIGMNRPGVLDACELEACMDCAFIHPSVSTPGACIDKEHKEGDTGCTAQQHVSVCGLVGLC
jgi:hypothetical protein